MSGFPIHPEAVTPEWLTERLREAGELDIGRVASVAWQPIGTGQVGDSARFTLKYEGGQGPATLAGKFPAADATSRGTAAAFGLYSKEVGFYRELAPQGIHVAHFVIDGGVRSAVRPDPFDRPDSTLDPDAIAQAYLAVLRQPRSAWSWELELRPWVESF